MPLKLKYCSIFFNIFYICLNTDDKLFEIKEINQHLKKFFNLLLLFKKVTFLMLKIRKFIEFLRKSPLNTPDKIKIRKHVTPERVIKKFDIEDVESSCDDFDLPHFRKPSLTYRHSSLGNPFMEKKLEQSGGE